VLGELPRQGAGLLEAGHGPRHGAQLPVAEAQVQVKDGLEGTQGDRTADQLHRLRQQGLPDTSRQVLSETLNIMGLNWLLQTVSTEKLLAAQLGVLPLYHYLATRK